MSRLPYLTCPGNVMPGLENYFEHGIEPGDFLGSVLSNDLREACARVDDINRYALWDIVAWLYNNPPSGSWGSMGAYSEWISSGGFQGRTEYYE